MEYAESRAAYMHHILGGASAGPVALYESGYHLAAFMAWEHFQVCVFEGDGWCT